MAHIIKLPNFRQQGNSSELFARAISETWLKEFEEIIQGGRFEDFGNVFVKDAWIRDFLTITWDFRTIQGRDKLQQYFKLHGTHAVAVERLRLSERGAFKPSVKSPCPGLQWIESMFQFETHLGRGKGMLRLVMDPEDANKKWKCFLINLTLQELKGHEEKLGLDRPYGYVDPTGGNWQQRRERRKEFIDEQPAVIVVGAGQSGLAISARLQQLGVSTLVIDRNARVGDSWRKRYRTLMTHDPVHYCHLPYIPFPSHWPYFTPKDKLADWLESYATLMELNVWCSTEILSSFFDEDSQVWTVTVKRADGSSRTLEVKHIVLATGNAGDATIPQIPGQDGFKGILYHGNHHIDASVHGDLSKKKVVVVGSGNSSHDLCQNFHECGAGSVTMLQRGGTYVITAAKGLQMLHTGLYEEGGPPTEDCDVLGQSLPIPVQFALNAHGTKKISAADRETLDGLTNAGFRLDYSEDGSGIYRKYITRGGGYYVDVGCSRLIIDGKIKVRSSPGGIARFAPNGLVLADGSELDADVVVLATGYETMHSTARRIFGDNVANRLNKVWDLDEEGEIHSIWRYSGHPNFWFMGGSLALCRIYSKLLALQIKAIEMGIYERPDKRVARGRHHSENLDDLST